MLKRQTRTGTYGSWYQYYLCDFDGRIILPDMGSEELNNLVKPIQAKLSDMSFYSTAERCDP